MKKLLTLLFSACLLIYLSAPAQAGYYSPSLATIQGMTNIWNAPGTTSNYFESANVGTAIRFTAELQYGNGLSSGWATTGIGYAPPPPEAQDLSAYNGIQLAFLNTNNSIWSVNLYVITGAGNTLYEDGWAQIAPGISTPVTLDFAAEGVLNLNDVKGFGFQIKGYMEYPQVNLDNPSNPDDYHVDVSTIPEPVSIMLLGMGAFALRRRK